MQDQGQEQQQPVSRIAQLGGTSGVVAAVFAAVGVAAALLELIPPMLGFGLLALALLSAVIGVVASVVGLVTTRASTGRAGRANAVRGLALSGAVLLAAILPQAAAFDLPRINDITTDFEKPPRFVALAERAREDGRDMTYPGESFARRQLPAYPDLGSLHVPVPTGDALDRVVAALESMPRTEIVVVDREAGRIEATQQSLLLRFVDDIVVRVAPTEAGSEIDVRSKSRDGRGDLGVNAKRIHTIFEKVKEAAP